MTSSSPPASKSSTNPPSPPDRPAPGHVAGGQSPGSPGWQKPPAPRSTSATPVSTQNGSRRLLGQPAGSGAGPPGGGPGYSGQGGLPAETGMEEVQGADLAGAELVVVDRQVVPAAAGVLGTLLGQDLVERRLAGLDLLALAVGVGGGRH